MELAINRHIVNHKEGKTEIVVGYKVSDLTGEVEVEDTLTVPEVKNWTATSLREAVTTAVAAAKAAKAAKAEGEPSGAIAVSIAD